MSDATKIAAPASQAWLHRLRDLIEHGHEVAPRGQPTLELLQPVLEVDMNYPALVCPERRPSYRFMAAEAFWILTGDDRVKTIEPYNGQIAQFSDDGERFFGAYGPHVVKQLPYVLRTLGEDRDTRQAWLRIWQDNPPPSKDVPCTLMLGWSIREGRLHCHAYMRSSDIWLGIPYDVFNFSVLSAYVREQLETLYGYELGMGTLHLTAASSHLYRRDVAAAVRVVNAGHRHTRPCQRMPWGFDNVMHALRHAMASENAFEVTSHAALWNFWEADDATG